MAETTIVDTPVATTAAAKGQQKLLKATKRKAHKSVKKYIVHYTRLSLDELRIRELINGSLPLFTAKRWLILPTLHWGAERYIFLMNLYHISSILRQIRRDSSRIITHPPLPQLFATPYDITENMLKQARNIAILNNRVRNQFQRLAHLWKTRRLKKANTEDLMTGEEPKHCICLKDYKNNSEYVFEADTIHKDMYERLLQNYYTFPEPLAPRNPYTNELLTFPQFFNIMRQLYQVPGKKVHWALDGLYSCSYNLKKFQNVMASRLRQALIHRIMSNPMNDTGNEILADFIEDCFKETTLILSEETIEYRYKMLRWAVGKFPTHPKICKWRAVCYKHQLQRINAIPPTLEEKNELNKEIERLILEVSRPDIETPYKDSLPPVAPVAPDVPDVQVVAVLNDENFLTWEDEFGLNHIIIIASDASFFEITG
jgi:hypothetical protein